MDNTNTKDFLTDLSLLAFIATGGFFLLFVSGLF